MKVCSCVGAMIGGAMIGDAMIGGAIIEGAIIGGLCNGGPCVCPGLVMLVPVAAKTAA